jgi:hypothetical protein
MCPYSCCMDKCLPLENCNWVEFFLLMNVTLDINISYVRKPFRDFSKKSVTLKKNRHFMMIHNLTQLSQFQHLDKN